MSACRWPSWQSHRDSTSSGSTRPSRVVDGLNAGVSHVDDLSDAEISPRCSTAASERRQTAAVIATADTVVICVPTPLERPAGPTSVRCWPQAVRSPTHLTTGTLVVLESTTYPGTTEEVLRPILEERSGLIVGERPRPGLLPRARRPRQRRRSRIANTPKVVGGLTAVCAKRAEAFYAQLDRAGRGRPRHPRGRDGQAAGEHLPARQHRARQRDGRGSPTSSTSTSGTSSAWPRTKPFGFQAFYPGPGVGGHCIPIDPNYLSHRVKEQLGYPFRFVELAQEINAGMPRYVVQRIQTLLNEDAIARRGARASCCSGSPTSPTSPTSASPPRCPLASCCSRRGRC